MSRESLLSKLLSTTSSFVCFIPIIRKRFVIEKICRSYGLRRVYIYIEKGRFNSFGTVSFL